MTEQEKKAFDFAADTVKQLITLATGIIALTITFSKDILGPSMLIDSTLIIISWILFIFSILFGIISLMALTGTLQPTQNNTVVAPNIYSKNVRFPSIAQVSFFVLGLICTVIFGGISMSNSKGEQNDSEKIEIVKSAEYKIVKTKKTKKVSYSK